MLLILHEKIVNRVWVRFLLKDLVLDVIDGVLDACMVVKVDVAVMISLNIGGESKLNVAGGVRGFETKRLLSNSRPVVRIVMGRTICPLEIAWSLCNEGRHENISLEERGELCPKSDLRCVEVLAPEEQHVYSPQVPDSSAPFGAAC